MFPLSGKVHAGSKISSREISSIYVDHEQYDRSNRQLCRTSRYGMIHSKNKTSEGDLLRGCVGRHVPHTNRHGSDEIWSGVSPSLYCVSYCVPIIGQCTA